MARSCRVRCRRGQITYPGYEHVKWEAVVQKMEPERLFSFTWHPYAVDPKVDYSKETPTLVEFRLETIPSGTLLQLTESGFDKIPSDRRLEAFRMNDGGWTEQLKNIETHVAQTVAAGLPSKRLMQLCLPPWVTKRDRCWSQGSVVDSLSRSPS